MPLLSLTMRGAELEDGVCNINLEKSYKFTELKLLHVYHNIDSSHLTSNSKNDSTNAVLLFIKLGGLVENHKQIENYAGNFETYVAHTQQNIYDKDDFQIGASVSTDNPNSTSSGITTTRFEPDVKFHNLIPIGSSRHGGSDIISRDVFKTLHKGSILDFNGELRFELHFLDSLAELTQMRGSTGGFVTDAKQKDKFVSFITLLFEYEEA